MILNKIQIIEEFKKGNIIYNSPMADADINNAGGSLFSLEMNCNNQSVDVNLGDWIYVPHKDDRIHILYKNKREVLKSVDSIMQTGWINISQFKETIIPRGVFFLVIPNNLLVQPQILISCRNFSYDPQ